MTSEHKTRASSSILAKILATENINVVYNPKAQTAMFDVSTRTLTLPVWEGMSEEVRDLLIGHEVGHALYTPYRECDKATKGGWILDAERIGGTGNAPYVQCLFNIVEDVRIEKLIKQKFPGLRRDFSIGYRELVDKDFFGTKGKDFSEFSFGDRINIHFKGGVSLNVPFSDEEMEIVNRVDSCETFDDMIAVSEEIFNHLNKQKFDNNPDEMVEVPVNISVDGISEDSEGDSQGNTLVNIGNDQGQEPSKENNPQQGGNSPTPKEKNPNSGKQGGNGNLPELQTQNKFDDNSKTLVRQNVRTVEDVTLPKPKIDRIVYPFKYTIADCDKAFGEGLSNNSMVSMNKINDKFTKFVNTTKPMISTLMKQFEMRKAADVQKRTKISKKGTIDCNRIFKYKVSEDIFTQFGVVSEGKNHGMVMYVDWSSSMSACTADILNQVIILTQFCRKMSIPFDVYLFSTQTGIWGNSPNASNSNLKASEQWTYEDTSEDSNSSYRNSFVLIQMLSSDMSRQQFAKGLKHLFTLGQVITRTSDVFDSYGSRLGLPVGYSQGNTPLDETILTATYMVPLFQAKHKVQIVNTIFLTDGEGGSGFVDSNPYMGATYVRLARGSKTYTHTEGSSSDIHLKIFREHTGSTAIGFFIAGNGYCKYFRGNEDKTKVRNDGFLDVQRITKTSNTPIHQYDRLFALKSSTKISEFMDNLDSLAPDASMTRIRNAFVSSVEERVSGRAFLNRLADVIAIASKQENSR